MSSSRTHDAHFPAIERFMRESCGCKHVVTEPMRGWSYGGAWASPDLFGWVDHHRTFAVDVKVSVSDAQAQLRKPYVIDARAGVGLYRIIALAGDAIQGSPVPDRWGRWAVTGDSVAELDPGDAFKARNWQQEAAMAIKAGGLLTGGRGGPGKKTAQITEKNREAREHAEFGIGMGALAKRLGMSRADTVRLVDRDPKLASRTEGRGRGDWVHLAE